MCTAPSHGLVVLPTGTSAVSPSGSCFAFPCSFSSLNFLHKQVFYSTVLCHRSMSTLLFLKVEKFANHIHFLCSLSLRLDISVWRGCWSWLKPLRKWVLSEIAPAPQEVVIPLGENWGLFTFMLSPSSGAACGFIGFHLSVTTILPLFFQLPIFHNYPSLTPFEAPTSSTYWENSYIHRNVLSLDNLQWCLRGGADHETYPWSTFTVFSFNGALLVQRAM